MRVVVTGAAGFIGANLVLGLNRHGIDDVIAVDDMTDGPKYRNLLGAQISDYFDKRDFYERFARGEFGKVDAPGEGIPVVTVDEDIYRTIKPGAKVAVNNSLSVVRVIGNIFDARVRVMELEASPDVTFDQVGGLNPEIEEVREAVEYPLTRPEIFERIGVEPPKGILLYGAPGTGKTLIAKAVAHEAKATFTRRTLTVTRAPIFRSCRRMVPQVAFWSLVPESPMRRTAQSST